VQYLFSRITKYFCPNSGFQINKRSKSAGDEVDHGAGLWKTKGAGVAGAVRVQFACDSTSSKVGNKSTVVPTVGFFGTVNRTPRELKGADGAFAEASSKVKGRSYEVTKKSTVVPTVGFFGTVNRTPRELKGADGLKQEYFCKILVG